MIPEFTADAGTKKGEKIDYAIVHEGQVQVLVEVKKINDPLKIEHASQLFRYFPVTNARIASSPTARRTSSTRISTRPTGWTPSRARSPNACATSSCRW
ncbi:hypothetical protein FHX82_002645 [Amycolatopsis bartoniae]|uniref:Type I restriction enzyme R protein N-terminal domain-containing protein n=1 Tax=Amycolatopsis bartoniae TaxID=941986 RepID=A0A8H9IZZ4_9PSEU|nr:hypothetical protein [Amycolatopsis bartoniae]MBB2935591.1 hypothetical protein [Amycolatopsis bartoniae]GHF76879.1 hypothetical protein GCM10017566_58980 [Amycolatopsis bartoniae]